MSTTRELGERKIVEIIWRQLDKTPNMTVPLGDDVATIRHEDDNVAVLKTDMLVGKTDVPPQMSYSEAARKAVVMNISDFAAKGAKPLGLVVSLGVPGNLTRKNVEEIGRGLNAGAREYGTYVLGGDTCETDDLIISVGLFGLAKKRDIISRSGAHHGDIVATTGPFGLASAGLKILKERLTAPPKIRKRLVEAVIMPRARLKEGLALAKTGAITASIDSSDGLAWSLHEVSRASSVGFIIDTPPIAREVYGFAELHSLNPLELCLYGGEEYELIVTVNPDGWSKAEETIACQGSTLLRIGTVSEEKKLLLKQKNRMVEIKPHGYEHFKQRIGHS